MPRYLVEGVMSAGNPFPPADLAGIIERNLMGSVTWICSFVGDRRTYALYEGPHPEAVRRAVSTTGLDVERVSEVRLFDPFAYPATAPTGVDREGETPAPPTKKEKHMPLFMDVHTLEGGVTVADVAGAHEKDLATQGAYGVAYKRYWVDEANGKIFCLAEGPDAETVSRVHQEAHGLVADEIYRVSEHT